MARIDNLPQEPWFDPATGNPTQEFRDWLEELTFGTSDNSINTVLSGQNGIINGTQPLADVLITDRGSLVAEQDAQTDNINDTASSGGDFGAVANPAFASNLSSGEGEKTTGAITVVPTNGVAPYSYAWTKVSGDTIDPDAPSSATTTFTGTVGLSGFLSGVYKCTVTDSTGGTPLTTTVNVTATIGDISGGIGSA